MGVQSTAEQLLQTTTVWLWLKTVVLRDTERGGSGCYDPHREGDGKAEPSADENGFRTGRCRADDSDTDPMECDTAIAPLSHPDFPVMRLGQWIGCTSRL